MSKYFFKTDRIGFREWNEDDLDLAKKLWLNENVTKYISKNGFFSEDEVEKRFATELLNQKEYGIAYWPMFLLETDEFIGCCGFRPYDQENNIIEFGIHILDNHWKKGYASEAGNAIIQYAFDTLKVADIFAGHNPTNEASRKMLLKLGFHDYKEEYYEPTGLMHPSYLYK